MPPRACHIISLTKGHWLNERACIEPCAYCSEQLQNLKRVMISRLPLVYYVIKYPKYIFKTTKEQISKMQWGKSCSSYAEFFLQIRNGVIWICGTAQQIVSVRPGSDHKDIFVFYNSHNVRLRSHSDVNSCQVLVGGPGRIYRSSGR